MWFSTFSPKVFFQWHWPTQFFFFLVLFYANTFRLNHKVPYVVPHLWRTGFWQVMFNGMWLALTGRSTNSTHAVWAAAANAKHEVWPRTGATRKRCSENIFHKWKISWIACGIFDSYFTLCLFVKVCLPVSFPFVHICLLFASQHSVSLVKNDSISTSPFLWNLQVSIHSLAFILSETTTKSHYQESNNLLLLANTHVLWRRSITAQAPLVSWVTFHLQPCSASPPSWSTHIKCVWQCEPSVSLKGQLDLTILYACQEYGQKRQDHLNFQP